MSDARSGSELFIVDNSESDWKVRNYLIEWCDLSKAIDIANGYFIETNLGAASIHRFCQRAVAALELLPEAWAVKVKPLGVSAE